MVLETWRTLTINFYSVNIIYRFSLGLKSCKRIETPLVDLWRDLSRIRLLGL